MEDYTPDFSVAVQGVKGFCPAGEAYAKRNISEGKIPVLSCEGPCIRANRRVTCGTSSDSPRLPTAVNCQLVRERGTAGCGSTTNAAIPRIRVSHATSRLGSRALAVSLCRAALYGSTSAERILSPSARAISSQNSTVVANHSRPTA